MVGLMEGSVRGQEDVAEQAAILDGCAAQDQGPRRTMEDTYILRNSLPLSEFSWTGRLPARSGLYAVCSVIPPPLGGSFLGYIRLPCFSEHM